MGIIIVGLSAPVALGTFKKHSLIITWNQTLGSSGSDLCIYRDGKYPQNVIAFHKHTITIVADMAGTIDQSKHHTVQPHLVQ